MSFRPWTLAVLLAASACSGGEVPAEGEVSPDAAVDEAPPLEMSKDDLAKGSENIALVPSVVETQAALEASGISTQLADLLPERKLEMKKDGKDNAAVTTGVLIADMLLTVKTAPKEKLLAHLAQIKAGMQALEGGNDIQNVIGDIEERVKADAVTRDELLKELDELSGAVIPELEFNGQERIVPLIQAGSWLEGANLVAKAVKQADKPAAADSLLKQPAVVAYFLKYVKEEGAEKAPAAITQKLEESLLALKAIADKTEPLTTADIDVVIKTTNDVLALL